MRRHNHHGPIGAGLVFLCALLAWAAPAAAQGGQIRLGTSLAPPSLDAIQPYVAAEAGLYRKHGLDVVVTEYRGGATAMKALLAGDLDVGVMGLTDVIATASKGARLRVFVLTSPVTPYHLVARKETANTVQALAGRNVGIAGVGGAAYFMTRMVLSRSGLDPDKVKYVVAGSPADRFKALITGKIDAALVPDMEVAKLVQYPDIASLARSATVLPEIPYFAGMAKEEYIERNVEAISRLTKALIETNRWIVANKAGTVEIVRKFRPEESAEVLSRAYDLTDRRLWAVNGELTEAAHAATADFLVKVGYVTTPVPYARLYDRRFVERALSDLGKM
jgi:ABC-type nitrate/sulfonate/bicarbonate transport system substrate-binding protein